MSFNGADFSWGCMEALCGAQVDKGLEEGWERGHGGVMDGPVQSHSHVYTAVCRLVRT